MGHTAFLSEEHKRVIQRLEAGQVALPEPDDPEAQRAWKEILEIVYSPEEADLAAKIPNRPSKLEVIISRTGFSEEELVPRLNGMADKGILLDIVNPRTQEVHYTLAPPVVGFIEFSMMRLEDSIPKEKMAKALEVYWHNDPAFAKEIFGTDTVVGRALVAETSLEEEQLPDVLDWERATALIIKARSLSVTHCYCRHKALHLGKKCDAPMEICLTMNGGADYLITRKFARKIDEAEGLDILEKARSSGLVQIADNVMNRPTYICNCCSCCCGQLTSIKEFGLHSVNPSNYSAEVSKDSCRGCSRCARACPVAAIEMTPVSKSGTRKNQLLPKIDITTCIGCGVCVTACGKNTSMKMVTRKQQPYVSKNTIERVIRMAIEKGRLPHLLFDEGAGRGSKFMNRLIKGICSLPGMQRVMASEQVKSRFVDYALKNIKNPTT